ncbi:gas vesicle protein [Kibdelosporangium aridum]|uniref:Gas vesicle protein n=1 Tax=Kibdelosporangium aridum TaxID=2030 RepID=A0A428Z203_KIBAR|nr:gas vesicle protein [Kibdelosporangium aridum]RSM79341.1 gas vesicle protein [Kibdelosporangium aridum]
MSTVENSPSTLADVLERVLDKGVVIVGDIAVNVVDIELLTLRLRLFIASASTAKELGMDWWTGDPFFAPKSVQPTAELEQLRGRVAELERALASDGVS